MNEVLPQGASLWDRAGPRPRALNSLQDASLDPPWPQTGPVLRVALWPPWSSPRVAHTETPALGCLLALCCRWHLGPLGSGSHVGREAPGPWTPHPTLQALPLCSEASLMPPKPSSLSLNLGGSRGLGQVWWDLGWDGEIDPFRACYLKGGAEKPPWSVDPVIQGLTLLCGGAGPARWPFHPEGPGRCWGLGGSGLHAQGPGLACEPGIHSDGCAVAPSMPCAISPGPCGGWDGAWGMLGGSLSSA